MADAPLRFAVVGGGQISQQAFLPALGRTGKAEFTALVSGDPAKREQFGRDHGVATWDYDQYPALLTSGTVDAVYIATPVFRHREFAVPALEAGIHALVEKPFEVSGENAQAMIDAADRGGATLMVAYRLHQEPGTVALMEAVRDGVIGDPRYFTSAFSQDIDEANHRGQNGFWGGPVADMGAYPLNQVRTLFGAEPLRVSAHGVRTPGRSFDFEDTVAVTLTFPGERVAQFTVSYATTPAQGFTLAGTAGSITSDACYDWGDDVAISWTVTDADGDVQDHRHDPVDQFAGQIDYFVDCVRSGAEPEPSGEEGLLDVLALEAIEESLRTGQSVDLPPRDRARRLSRSQVRTIAPPRKPEDEDLTAVVTQNR
ncbi:glucose-fructose oxidoreductase [Tersicoccus solisilvae]|uniref:Glucose-fructose oxidoreductase n=1 Tax=Tersicoccus solisilvae TaxID=1882339 RepID=A0ABQ1NUS1_9MICC|nr:Gfo/Idh/MocA family oxidoreductase [Tersicoccus solisilvae]GGC83229.1 glucose-fructose oxidoreductase [Tersicoccus solisilvae]